MLVSALPRYPCAFSEGDDRCVVFFEELGEPGSSGLAHLSFVMYPSTTSKKSRNFVPVFTDLHQAARAIPDGVVLS